MQSKSLRKTSNLAEYIPVACAKVVAHLPPPNSGAKRVQQLGILYAVLVLIQMKEKATVKAISQLVGMQQSSINTILKDLLEAGVVERESMSSKIGHPTFLYLPVSPDCEGVPG